MTNITYIVLLSWTCICCKQLIQHSVQCSVCNESSQLRCTHLSQDNIKEQTSSETCNSCSFGPETPRVRVVSLHESSWSFVAKATSQRGREPESDLAAELCPNTSQTTNYATKHNRYDRETSSQDNRLNPNFLNNFQPSARVKFSNFHIEVVHRKRKFIRISKC